MAFDFKEYQKISNTLSLQEHYTHAIRLMDIANKAKETKTAKEFAEKVLDDYFTKVGKATI